MVVEFIPTINNRSVNMHGGKLRCGALVYHPLKFERYESTLPLVQYQFKTKDGNGLNFHIDTIVLTPLATVTTRNPRNNFQKYNVN